MQVMLQYYQDWRMEIQSRTGTQADLSQRHSSAARASSDSYQQVQEEIDSLVKALWDYDNATVMHPDCAGFYSIFLQTDPVAYRVEPLISKQLAQTKVSMVPTASRKGYISVIPNVDIASRASGLFDTLKNTIVSTMAFQRALEVEESKADSGSVRSAVMSPTESVLSDATAMSTLPTPSFTTDEVLAALNPRKRRLDFCLPQSFLGAPAYFNALAAHSNYWSDENCNAFVLREIYEIDDVSTG
jgi:hypothetical protein